MKKSIIIIIIAILLPVIIFKLVLYFIVNDYRKSMENQPNEEDYHNYYIENKDKFDLIKNCYSWVQLDKYTQKEIDNLCLPNELILYGQANIKSEKIREKLWKCSNDKFFDSIFVECLFIWINGKKFHLLNITTKKLTRFSSVLTRFDSEISYLYCNNCFKDYSELKDKILIDYPNDVSVFDRKERILKKLDNDLLLFERIN